MVHKAIMVTWRYTATVTGGLGGGISQSPYDVPIASLGQGLAGLGDFLDARKQELGFQLLWVSFETSLRDRAWDTPDEWQEVKRLHQ